MPYILGAEHKFGVVTDVDTASVPEDVWDMGGIYPFPAAAAATTVVSDSAEDGAGTLTGALSVVVHGLDSEFMLLSEIVTMNGTGVVSLNNDYYRVFRPRVLTAGSNETNVGNIDVKHGATILGRIMAGNGTSLMAIYTIPAGFQWSHLKKMYLDLGRSGGGAAITMDAKLEIRPPGGAWYVQHPLRLVSTISPDWQYEYVDPGVPLEQGTDLRWRITSVSANNTIVQAGFSIAEVR